jgi:flagellar capping protein FliD
VDQLSDVERAPQRRLRTEQVALGRRNTAYANIATQLSALKTRADALADATLFISRLAQTGDSTVASAAAASGAALGTYTFNFTQLATASAHQGTVNAGQKLNATNDVSGLVLSSAGLGVAVTAGTFTVNGQQVTIATSDTLQGVFDKISTATGGAVTGSYDNTTDKISLSSGSEIVLGSATDTSNFLAVTKLYNTGTGAITSTAALGVVKQTAALASANFATAVSDGGAGAGEFKINGVSISFSASVDTVTDLVARINNSAAGVTASYDTLNDRFTLTSKSTGDVGIALQDVTGNFMAASGLSTGALARGKDLVYTVNGGGQLTSHSNVITDADHGIQGLTVTALKGAETVTAAPDTLSAPMLIGQFGGAGIATRVRATPPHNLQHGHAIRFQTTGTLPSQINADTTYWVRRVDSTNVTIHPTAADATANTNAINFGTAPPYTGDAYMVQVDPLTGGSTTGPDATTTVTVSSDTAKVKTAINDFLAEYNKSQALIDSQTASTTDAKGKVTAGTLAAESDASELAGKLRATANAAVSGLTGSITQLAALGIDSNGTDDTLALSDSTLLDAALADNLNGVKDLFSHATGGLGVQLSAYLERVIGEEGSLVTKQDNLDKQVAGIDTQVSDLERLVLLNEQRLVDSFIAMETAQSKINQQLQFLTQRFGTQ